MVRGAKSKIKLPAWIVGGLGLATIAGAGGYGLLQQSTYREEARHQAADYADHAALQIQQSCIRLSPAEKARCVADARAEYELKARDNRREYDDLVAQRKSALWTFVMGMAALIGMALSAVGVFLVKQTFDETRRTNRIAMRENARATRRAVASARSAEAALGIAERNAKAAADQVELARDTASKQLRAYIGVLGAKAFYVGAPLSRVVIEIKNYGQTPAYNVTSHTGLYIDTHQIGFPGKGDNGNTVIFASEFGIVEPGQERVIWVNLPENWISENIEALRAGKVRLFSETKIQYSDVGGVSRHRGFCCFLPRLRNPDGRDPGVPMTITAGGNIDSWVGNWAEKHHLPVPEEKTAD